MDIVEFAEQLYGKKLAKYQIEIIKKIKDLPPDSKLVYWNGAFHIIKIKDKDKIQDARR